MFSISESLSDPIYLTQNITISLVPLVMAIIALIIHVAFAVAIFKDASGRRTNGRVVWFVHPIIWAGATLLGSVFVAAVYWAIHYSTFAPPEKQSASEPIDV